MLGITTTGEFLQSNDCGSDRFRAERAAPIHVNFTPQTVADYINGTLTVSSDAAGSPHAAALEGRGISGAVFVAVGDKSVQEGDGRSDLPRHAFQPRASRSSR